MGGLMRSIIWRCVILLVVTAAHFIGVHGTRYVASLMEKGGWVSMSLDLVPQCVLSYDPDITQFVCGHEGQTKKGIAQKQNGEWVSFNCVTGWWKRRNANQVIYAASIVRMTVKKGTAVFHDSVSGSEAFFTLGARSASFEEPAMEASEEPAMEASEEPVRPTTMYMLRASEARDDLQVAAGWNFVSVRALSWQLAQREYSCTRGIALVPKRNDHAWAMFGRFSLNNKRNAVAFICPGKDIKLKENKGFAEFRFQDAEQTDMVLMVRLGAQSVTNYIPFTPPATEAFFYIRYRPNGKMKVEPGFLKVPVGRKCRVTNVQGVWHCTADDNKDATKLKGLWIRANPATAYSLLDTTRHRQNIQPYGPAAYIYAGDGVKLTTTLYVPFTARKATFRHTDTKETAVFYLGDVTPVFPAEEADVERTAFAKRLMDNEDHFKLRLYSTDKEYTELLVQTATGFISYSNVWQYNSGPPDRADQGVAIFEPFETAIKSRVAYFKGDRPLEATAVVYAGPNVKISQRDGKVYFTEKTGQLAGYIRVGDSQIRVNDSHTAKHCLVTLPYTATHSLRSVQPGTKCQFTAKLGHPAAAQFIVGGSNVWTLTQWDEDVDIQKLGEGPFLVVTAVAKRFEDDVTLHLAQLWKSQIPVVGVVALFYAGERVRFVPYDGRDHHDIRLETVDQKYNLKLDAAAPLTATWNTALQQLAFHCQ